MARGNFPKGGLTEGINGWLEKKRFQWRDERGRFMSYEQYDLFHMQDQFTTKV